jgi:hypothetical protein
MADAAGEAVVEKKVTTNRKVQTVSVIVLVLGKGGMGIASLF